MRGRDRLWSEPLVFPCLKFVPPREPIPGPVDDPNGKVGGDGEQWK